MSKPFILGPGERHPEAPLIPGPVIRIASAQSDGLLALGEVALPPRTAGPNLHVHANEDELFYVLDGVMTVRVGDELHDVAKGGLAWGARGVPHTFANLTTEPLRLLLLWVPGGAEEVFVQMHEYHRTRTGDPDQALMDDIMARHGATRLGPGIAIPPA
jgi:mannose-6-phosphate isomerase-like protein (cupin superfamily)